MSNIVFGYGTIPNRVMIVGEAPGAVEAKKSKPFVGPAGILQRDLLSRAGFEQRLAYRTNIVKEHTPGNPDPTPEQIDSWTPILLDEIEECQPEVILAVGAFATRWFLGEEARLRMVHGVVQEAGAFDPTRSGRAPEGCVVVPVHHPAGALHDDGKGDALGVLYWDYLQAVKAINHDPRPPKPLEDEYLGQEDYTEVTGRELGKIYNNLSPKVIGFDTEGRVDSPYTLQVSHTPGSAYVLRHNDPEFHLGVQALQRLADKGTTFIGLNLIHDLEVARAMGLELRRASLFDLMAGAYVLRTELEQNLKALAWRFCGMRVLEFVELAEKETKRRQVEYLKKVKEGHWDDPEPRPVQENDSTIRIYTPEPISRSAGRVLTDLESGKVTKEGPVDPEKRWKKIDDAQKPPVEEDLGPFPFPRPEDVPHETMIDYAARDADAALRIYLAMIPVLQNQDLLDTAEKSMEVFPVFEEMSCTGVPAHRPSFEALYEELNKKVFKMGKALSRNYNAGRPFNPNSGPQVRRLLKRKGLKPAKKTKKTREWSVSQDSIKHLRFEDQAIQDIFDWRELQHLRDSFCKPILERVDPKREITWIRGQIKWTRTATRRLAYQDPNLLNIPSRTEQGRRIRDCYVAPPGFVLGSSDLSQIEARVLAHLSQDPLLIELFNSNRDIHVETASRIFERPVEEVTKEERTAAKTINYGTIYGQQAQGLKTQLGMLGIIWPMDKCYKMNDKWYEVYSGVKDYGDWVFEEAQKTGQIRDLSGMPRYVVGVWSRDEYTREEARRVAVSHTVQGTAQTMIQNSMIWLKNRVWDLQDQGVKVMSMLQYHDELIFVVEEDWAERLGELVVEALTKHTGVELCVPVEAEWAVSRTWGGLK